MARGNKHQRSTTLKEAISKALWAIQNIGKSRRVSISDWAPQELATPPPHVQWGPPDTIHQTSVPKSMMTPTTATWCCGRRVRIWSQENSRLLDMLCQTKSFHWVLITWKGYGPKHNQWIKKKDLFAQELLNNFHKRYPQKPFWLPWSPHIWTPLSVSSYYLIYSPPSTMSSLLWLLTLFCTCVLIASLTNWSLAPATLVSTPVLIVLITHLLTQMVAGTEHAPTVFLSMLHHPGWAAWALINTTIQQLPLPPWLREWLTSLAQCITNIHWLSSQTHKEVFALGGILRDLSALLQHLVNTFWDFATCTAQIAKLTEPILAVMVELTEALRASQTTLNNIGIQIFDMDTHIVTLRNELLKLWEFIGLCTAYVEDGDLHLILNTILTHLAHLATTDQIHKLQNQLSQTSTSASSLSPFHPPHSTQSLSPLPMSTLQAPFSLHASLVLLQPSPTPKDREINDKNEPPVTALPYNANLTPWADPEVTQADLHIVWEDCTWQTGTYCSVMYEYFVTGPPHNLHFVGITNHHHQVFGNSKHAIGKLVGQEEGLVFSMSGIWSWQHDPTEEVMLWQLPLLPGPSSWVILYVLFFYLSLLHHLFYFYLETCFIPVCSPQPVMHYLCIVYHAIHTCFIVVQMLQPLMY